MRKGDKSRQHDVLLIHFLTEVPYHYILFERMYILS